MAAAPGVPVLRYRMDLNSSVQRTVSSDFRSMDPAKWWLGWAYYAGVQVSALVHPPTLHSLLTLPRAHQRNATISM